MSQEYVYLKLWDVSEISCGLNILNKIFMPKRVGRVAVALYSS